MMSLGNAEASTLAAADVAWEFVRMESVRFARKVDKSDWTEAKRFGLRRGWASESRAWAELMQSITTAPVRLTRLLRLSGARPGVARALDCAMKPASTETNRRDLRVTQRVMLMLLLTTSIDDATDSDLFKNSLTVSCLSLFSSEVHSRWRRFTAEFQPPGYRLRGKLFYTFFVRLSIIAIDNKISIDIFVCK